MNDLFIIEIVLGKISLSFFSVVNIVKLFAVNQQSTSRALNINSSDCNSCVSTFSPSCALTSLCKAPYIVYKPKNNTCPLPNASKICQLYLIFPTSVTIKLLILIKPPKVFSWEVAFHIENTGSWPMNLRKLWLVNVINFRPCTCASDTASSDPSIFLPPSEVKLRLWALGVCVCKCT